MAVIMVAGTRQECLRVVGRR